MKQKLIIYLSAAFFVVSLLVTVFFYEHSHLSGDLSDIIDYKTVNFAGEKVSFDGKYAFNREKFERELAVTKFNTYQFVLYHKREPLFFPYIEKKLKENGIPDDFKYLAVAESGLRNDSRSDANAGGIWQFVPGTAEQYGLIVNDQIDERYSFEKSTDAAMKYFKKLSDDFNDWTLVAASYNRGENGIKRAQADQGVTSYYDLYLNDETSRYVFRILSIKYLMENRKCVFNSDDLGDQFVLPKTRTLTLGKIDNLSDWCQKNHVDYMTLRQMNQWILQNSLPDGKWSVQVLDL